MRRIQILLEPELDDQLERVADHRGMSKSAVVRDCLREALEVEHYDNGLQALTATFDGRPDDSASIDAVVYEQGR